MKIPLSRELQQNVSIICKISTAVPEASSNSLEKLSVFSVLNYSCSFFI